MDLQYFRKIINIFDESQAESLEIEEEGIKLKVSKKATSDGGSNQGTIIHLGSGGVPVQYQPQQNIETQIPVSTSEKKQTKEAKQVSTEKTEAKKLHEIKSPIVGTFYRTPSPDSDPFVDIGTKVSAGTTLCIIEAMKLMNEIESDISGTIEKIIIENGNPVEYGQVLFLIKKD